MNNIRVLGISALLGSVMLLLASCAVDTVVVKQGYDFKKIKRVAVLDFRDSSYRYNRGPMVSELFVKYMLKAGYAVIERSELQSLLKEQNLASTGVLDQEQVKAIGKISGVDALISGSITLDMPEQYFYETEGTRFIAAQAGVTCRMISVETGEVLWAGSNTYDGMNIQTAFEYVISSIVSQLESDISNASRRAASAGAK